MKRTRLFLMLSFFLLMRPLVWASDGCADFGKPFVHKILPKINSGIPFELVSLIVSNNKLVAKRNLHLRYNLWDEELFIREKDKSPLKIKVKSAQSHLCRELITDLIETSTKTFRLNILLNPMTPERAERLAGATGKLVKLNSVISVDWEKVISNVETEDNILSIEVSQ